MRALLAKLVAVLVITGFVAVAIMLARQQGSVSIVWHGEIISMRVGVALVLVLAASTIIAAVFLALRMIVNGPRGFLRRRRERRRRKGYHALTQGMVAVAAGDAGEALKHARRADTLLADPPLTLLLSAQAAQLNGDEQAAKRFFTAMLERAETEFLGLRGLIMHALRRNDEATALKLAERARALRPRTPWVISSLFELQARAGDWTAADATLAEGVKRKALPAPAARHQRAVLHHERSRRAEAEGLHRDALRFAAKAYALDPGFVPSASRYAELLRVGGKLRHARKVIEGAWRAAPHPTLARAYDDLAAGEAPLARVKHMERLAAAQPGHVESHIALAATKLKAGLWGEARRHLNDAGAHGNGNVPQSSRVYRLMAEVEEAEHHDPVAARAWLAKTSAAASSDHGWVCRDCGAESPDWNALCSRCRSFDSIEWRHPNDGLAVLRLAAAAGDLAPALPVPTAWHAPGHAIDGNGARR